ncbi:hypothetical protein DFA_10216 [Cavenderia fasciculata]|uniref:Uncharacterized protein n=1 Tax=Cavenderia fasciculata TaxID=261658 RepID=F4Q9L3_CACFS|nr:uncharacterized protein DFA_10216 [Cavenderia fasciculata]EGG15382.1 hypothetical protein DFA_10216 [Cavenderia fasciculata]|eukprot:XP_004354124.1 hypothetical protein DFA_10216 [Cavenderia fasciculata]
MHDVWTVLLKSISDKPKSFLQSFAHVIISNSCLCTLIMLAMVPLISSELHSHLDYVLNSKFCNDLYLDLGESVAAVVEMGGIDTDRLIERLVTYAKQFTGKCHFRLESVHKYTQHDYQGRDQFISAVKRILDKIDLNYYGQPIFRFERKNIWILDPALLEKISTVGFRYYYYFLFSAAMSTDIKLYKKVLDMCTPRTYDLIKILCLVVRAGHYQFARQFINTSSINTNLMTPKYLKKSMNILFKLYFDLINKDLQQSQVEVIEGSDNDTIKSGDDHSHQSIANVILDLLPSQYQSHILYYATDLTDNQLMALWSGPLYLGTNLKNWLYEPSKHLKLLKYDQKFFNHLERLYRFYQNHSNIYKVVEGPPPLQLDANDPPPLTIEYIEIWSQCLDSYYYNNNDTNAFVSRYTQQEYNKFIKLATSVAFVPNKLIMEDVNNDREDKKSQRLGMSNQLFSRILNQTYLRSLIFNHVSSIHKQLGIKTTRITSTFIPLQYIQYGLNDLFFKHIDLLWSLMFASSNGVYRNDHADKLYNLMTSAIHYNNHQVLEYLLNRIKNEIGPFQSTTITIKFDRVSESKKIRCLSLRIFKLLSDDNILIESDILIHRMAKTAIIVIGDVDVIRNWFNRYNLSNLKNLFTMYPSKVNGIPKLKDLFNKKTDTELIELYNVVSTVNKKMNKRSRMEMIMQALVQDRIKVIEHIINDGKDKKWKRALAPLFFSNSPSSSKKYERMKAIIFYDHKFNFKYDYDDDQERLLEKIADGTDIEYLRYISSPQVSTPADFKSVPKEGISQLDFHTVYLVHRVFCTRHYIDLLSAHVRGNFIITSNIIQSTLLQAPKGKEYAELDYVLNSKFGEKCHINIAESVGFIIDKYRGDNDMLERLIEHARKFPWHCRFPFGSIDKYTIEDYPQRNQFISIIEKVLAQVPFTQSQFKETTRQEEPILYVRKKNIKRILIPSLLKKISNGSNFCLEVLDNTNMYIYRQMFRIIYGAKIKVDSVNTYDRVTILCLLVGGGYHRQAQEFIVEYLDLVTIDDDNNDQVQQIYGILYQISLHLIKKKQSQQQVKETIMEEDDISYAMEIEHIDQQVDYQELADQILDLMPLEYQPDILFYAKDLTDEQFIPLWERFYLDSNLEDWLDHSSHPMFFQYDQTFFNHLERLYRLYQQEYGIDEKMDAPPLVFKYFKIWNQCLDNYYYNFDDDDNNTNTIVNRYTKKEYDDFMDWVTPLGFIPSKLISK